MTSIEQEIEADRETWLERVNIHLEKLLEKANKENNMLRHMKKSLLGDKSCLQGTNQYPEGKVKEGIKASQTA